MDLFCNYRHCHPLLLTLSLIFIFKGVSGASFTFVNKCDYTVWPGILASAGSPKLSTTGFALQRHTARTIQAPTGWSGRFWGRTGCNFDSTGSGSCATADCGSGQMECNGGGASPPATLAEFTLGSPGSSQDYYDVSLVDGYNLPVLVEASRGSGACGATGCVTDLNKKCPAELRASGGGACRSACEAFGKPEYCCSEEYDSPAACKPSMYSEIFKSACPKSYSYAYDDATSTFTCSGADYTVTFCPSFPSLKSSSDQASNSTSIGKDGSGTSSSSSTGSGSGSGSNPVEQTALAATSWEADLATGGSGITDYNPSMVLQYGLVLAISIVALTLQL